MTLGGTNICRQSEPSATLASLFLTDCRTLAKTKRLAAAY